MTNMDEGVAHNLHVIAGSVDEALPTFTPADGPQSLTFTIEAAGTYEFRCDVHPTTMIGALVVTE
jgi:plastocyanin